MIDWPEHLKEIADQTMAKTNSGKWFSRCMKTLVNEEDLKWMKRYFLNFAKIQYILKNNLEDIPRCRGCGSYNINFNSGSWHCSAKCAANDKETRQKAKTTLLERYGVDNPNKSKEVREKSRKTCLEKYGAENPSKSKIIQDKIKQTCLEKYGVENPFASKDVQEKIKQTNLEKYGVECTFQSEEVKEKSRQTCLKRYRVENIQQIAATKEKSRQTSLQKYGVEHPSQNEEIKAKTRQTNLQKYGVEYSMQNEEVREKARQTILERYGVEYPMQNKNVKERVRQTNLQKYSVENAMQNEKIKEKAKQTNLERYGVEWTLQSENVKDKARQTNLEKYGVEYVSQSSEIIEKIRQTNLKCRGVDWVSKDEAVKQKKIETSRRNYGVDCHLQAEAIKKQIAQTNLKKYGNVCSLHGEEVREKVIATMKERYGCENPSQSPEIKKKLTRSNRINWREWNIKRLLENHVEVLASKEEYVSSGKIRCKCLLCGREFETEGRNYTDIACPDCNSGKEGITWSRPEKEIAAFIRNAFPGLEVLENVRSIIYPQELDIYVPDADLAIEFNGTYWHSDVFKDEMYHLNKSFKCLDRGIRLIHIFEWEWDLCQDGIKNLIVGALNARLNCELNENVEKYEIKPASYEECHDFVSKNGIADMPEKMACSRKIVIDEVIAGIAAWNDGCLECLCLDGSRKFDEDALKRLLCSYVGDSFIYSCDLAKESVDAFCKIGFVVKEQLQPKSIYIKGNDVEYDNCFNDDEMKNNGWYHLYDCGTIILQWNRQLDNI